jgi:hypothetical protein
MTESHPATGFALWGGRKMLTLALLGFASGLPLYLTSRSRPGCAPTRST